MNEVGVPTVVEELCDVLDRVFNLELVTALMLSAELSSVLQTFFLLEGVEGNGLDVRQRPQQQAAAATVTVYTKLCNTR